MRVNSWCVLIGASILGCAEPGIAAVPACSGQNDVYPCAVAGVLLVNSKPAGQLFANAGTSAGQVVSFINDPQNPGISVTSGSSPLLQAGGFGTVSVNGSVSLGTVSGQASIIGGQGSIACGVTGNASLTLTITGAGATTTLNCPKMSSEGAVATVTGQASFPTPVSSFVQTATLNATAPTRNDTVTVTAYTVQASIAANAPSIISDGTGVINGGSYAPGQIVSGSWVAVKGAGFTDSGVTVDWSNSDFSHGLPMSLNGVQVLFNGEPGAVWYLIDGSPQQINVQAPANLNSSVSVQVVRNQVGSNTVTTTAMQVAPAIFCFTLDAGKTFYPSAVFLDGTRLGDPAIFPGARKAKAGDIVLLFANSLEPSPAGVVSVSGTTHTVTVTIGSASFSADYSGLVAPGEFQINLTVPPFASSGNFPITIQVDGVTSQMVVQFPYSN